jgi:hypothetical protein
VLACLSSQNLIRVRAFSNASSRLASKTKVGLPPNWRKIPLSFKFKVGLR